MSTKTSQRWKNWGPERWTARWEVATQRSQRSKIHLRESCWILASTYTEHAFSPALLLKNSPGFHRRQQAAARPLWTRPLAKYTRAAAHGKTFRSPDFWSKMHKDRPSWWTCDSFLWHHFSTALKNQWKIGNHSSYRDEWKRRSQAIKSWHLLEKIPRFTTVLLHYVAVQAIHRISCHPFVDPTIFAGLFFLVDHNWGGAHQQEKKLAYCPV